MQIGMSPSRAMRPSAASFNALPRSAKPQASRLRTETMVKASCTSKRSMSLGAIFAWA